MNNTPKQIKIGHWNAQGIYSKKGKINEFKHFVTNNNLDIITINEAKIGKRHLPKIPGYETLYNPTDTPLRGILLFFKKQINITNSFIADITTHNICIEINNKLLIAAIYIQANKLNHNDFKLLEKHQQQVVIVGDYNAKSTDWHNANDNTNGYKLKRVLDNTNLILFEPNEHTCYTNPLNPSTIDLVTVKNTYIENMIVHPDLESDHRPLTFTIKTAHLSAPPKYAQYDFSQADWTNYKKYINETLRINRQLNNTQEIDQTVETLTTIIQQAADLYIPKTDINDITQNNLPKDIQQQIKLKNHLRRTYQKQPTEQNRNALQNQQVHVNTLLYEHDTLQWKKRITNAQNKRGNVWREIKNIKYGNTLRVAPLIDKDNQNPDIKICNTQQKANLLAKTFSENHQLTQNLSDRQTENEIANTLENLQREEPIHLTITTTPNQIRKLIRHTRPYKAPGKDKVQNKMLKNLPRKAIVQIYYIFKESLNRCYFPDYWKHAIILPILKKDKNANQPTSYRPISLLPVIGKIFEQIINQEIKHFLFETELLIPEQFGFRQDHTTIMQAARIINKAKLNFNIKHTTSLALLDIEKAFDVVWHDALIHKMSQANFPLQLIKLIQNYLLNRTYQVKINDTLSNPVQMTAGIPQGGALSATLFLIYVNDLPKTNQAQLAMFADDTAVIAMSRRTWLANQKITNYLQLLANYFKKWKLQINAEKTKLINFNTKITKERESTIELNETEIQSSETVRYLGIELDRKLNFRSHINKTIAKATAASNFISNYIKKESPLPEKLKLQLYTAYVRPILTYASPVIISVCDQHLKKLQTIETKTLRKIKGLKAFEISNRELYRQFPITPLPRLMYQQALRFFDVEINRSTLTMGMGLINPNNLPFKVKHKMIHQRILDLDPNM